VGKSEKEKEKEPFKTHLPPVSVVGVNGNVNA
jgi:hypothetical protein